MLEVLEVKDEPESYKIVGKWQFWIICNCLQGALW